MSKYGYQKMSKLDGFGPVYLINLKDHTHRLKNAIKEFKKYNVTNYTVIEAIDGRKNDLSQLIVGDYPRITPSEIGCIMSHIKALQYWIETSDSEYAIIMEDDFSFDTVQFWQWDWEYFVKKIPPSADIVQLVMIQNQPIKFNLHKKASYNHRDKTNYSWSTACYLIKRKYAKQLIKEHLVNEKYRLRSHGFKNQAADVVLYNLGNAYSMPLFTHMLDPKNSINSSHASFHSRSRNFINSWWEKNAKLYSKDQFFDLKRGLVEKVKTPEICFTIFHDYNNNNIPVRRKLVQRAKTQLLDSFDELQTPTIIIKNKEQVKNFYKKSKIKIYSKGHDDEGWKPGELGIWASNYTAWQNFVDSKYDYLILMEDDIQLSKNFNKLLVKYIDELPADWDVFTAYIPPTGNIRYKQHKKDLMIGKENVCKVYQSWSCLCYVVSKSGAKKLLKEVKEPVAAPLDNYLFYHKNLNVYSIKMELSNICNVYRTSSTVQESKEEDMTGYV